jgi:hypothetical protein
MERRNLRGKNLVALTKRVVSQQTVFFFSALTTDVSGDCSLSFASNAGLSYIKKRSCMRKKYGLRGSPILKNRG